MRQSFTHLTVLAAALLVLACEQQPTMPSTLFSSIPASSSGLDFENTLSYDRDFNIYTYRNFYNGGGVAMGDVNGDGLIDLYFSANMLPNRLFLNKGNFEFEDITEAAGVAGTRAWSTGVSMADVNGDGLLDIYVCNSGDISGDNKQNELFINQGIGANDLPSFKEQAEEYGIADRGFSTHAAFFDYDKDGDLDLYLLNNSFKAIGSFNLMENERNQRDSLGGDKLFRNDGNRFVDVSEAAGIYGSIIGFGLGVTVGDVDRDGWQDIYVSNDFFERDYLYLNQHDGTFREVLTGQFRSISAASMGADMADLNEDGYPEIFVTDMLPEQDARLKQVTMFEDWNKYQLNLKQDYYHQFSRNMLHLNNADGTFSEIGRLVGVEATDWSWGALFCDLDNDGLRDIFVANGIYQDLTDLDYINFIADQGTQAQIISRDGVDYRTLIDSIPVRAVSNYAFHNTGFEGDAARIPRFENKAAAWGLDQPSFSNGSAYGDLDNDGDLDLVVNNVNMPAFLYRNNSEVMMPEHHWLKFDLQGEGKNPFALGTQIEVFAGERFWLVDHMPMRGFQSSMDPRPLLGLGNVQTVDSVVVTWPDGRQTRLGSTATSQVISLRQSEAGEPRSRQVSMPAPLMTALPASEILPFVHQENDHNDFDRDRLIYHMMSTEGPAFAVGDMNGDGREDVFIGGAANQAGAVWLQQPGGKFRRSAQPAMAADARSEDVDAALFDADGDGDLDLYVASGGNEFTDGSVALADRLYFNNGNGTFTKSPQLLPAGKLEVSSCVHPADFDGDGDIDLAVGIRLQPFYYGVPVQVYLLENDGKGKFSDVTARQAPELKALGMITDLKWVDVDGDKDADLIVVGDWMAPALFVNENGKLTKKAAGTGLEGLGGWWTCIEPGDLDGDGDVDLVLGNHGWNSRFRASAEKPIHLFVNDFDGNGTAEQIMARPVGDTLKTYLRKPDLTNQMPGLRRKYLRFSSFVNESMTDIFGEAVLNKSVEWTASQLGSIVALNRGDGTFEWKNLPIEAQVSPLYGMVIHDFNGDKQPDLLLGGNFYRAKPEVGRYDASYGLLLQGEGQGNFRSLSAQASGFQVDGEIRRMAVMNLDGRSVVVVIKNNGPVEFYRY